MDPLKYRRGGPSKYIAYALVLHDGCPVGDRIFNGHEENGFSKDGLAAFVERGFRAMDECAEFLPGNERPEKLFTQYQSYSLLAMRDGELCVCCIFERPENNESIKRYETAAEKLAEVARNEIDSLLS